MVSPLTISDDVILFGWNARPGIVSVWADREGQALVWQRQGAQVTCSHERFRPWLLAAHLDDLAHLGGALLPDDDEHAARAAITYRVLDGSGDSYRYLLSARSGRMLERALLHGAARRLGRTVARLYELDADYERVGAVEQYLMLTGQVYFRDLVYADLHRMQFDLETTALDPQTGRIFMVAVRDTQGLATTLEAPDPADEARLIAELCDLIQTRDPDVIENHNLFGFDLPFLEARAATLGAPLSLGRRAGPARLERIEEPARWSGGRAHVRYSVAGRELIDTLDAVRRYDFVARDLPSHRLKDVARHFGLASTERTYIAGADVATTYARDPATVRRYALDDVAEVDALSQRLLSPAFALAQMAPRRYERAANAGPAMGILEPMLVRAYLRAGAAIPRGAGAHDGNEPHAGGALELFATGIARHVVKADVASLYPSLMRAERIGPQRDTLGALLHIVDRLTALRLHHKLAVRAATPGSVAAGHHNAMQAAMKLIINSAYGYMGAGTMALFADRAAADTVTRRGRAVLHQIVDSLSGRGVALIEADTDGVYFAVPPAWGEQDERALVADVGASLPPGIALEYEGRYAAMFSHEVKNYALLTYAGDLIVRGVALRSSRSEPFGEAFLRAALRCAMEGDAAGVQRVYQATVAAIRARALPTADMTTRVRLSKTPEAYRTARAQHKEAVYEALLNSGRTDWTPGERVRCYHAVGGQARWLPDPGEGAAPAPDPCDYDPAYYVNLLVTSYAGRLRKAFTPADWSQIFRTGAQIGLFDTPVAAINVQMITVP